MAVAFSAKMTGGNGTSGECQKVAGATSISSTGMTVNSGDTVLIATLHFQGSAVSNVAVTWNSTSMTINASNDISNNGVSNSHDTIAYLFSPAAGNKTLAASWTGSADCYMSCISFSGSDTTASGVDNFVEGSSGTTVTVTSTSDGATVASWGTDGSEPTVNFTKIFGQADLNPGAAASYTLGGSSNGHTFTGAGGSTPAYTGIHIVAASGGGGGPTVKTLAVQGVG